MIDISKNDVQQLWNQLGYVKTWDSLRNVLQQHLKVKDGMNHDLVNSLLKEVNDLQSRGIPFPNSQEKMHEVLNQPAEAHR